MKNHQTNINTNPVVYSSPQCDVTETAPEGVLCASMQQLEEDNELYGW